MRVSLTRNLKRQVEEKCMRFDLSKENVFCRSWWIVVCNRIATRLRGICPPLLLGDTTASKTLVYLLPQLNIKNVTMQLLFTAHRI